MNKLIYVNDNLLIYYLSLVFKFNLTDLYF